MLDDEKVHTASGQCKRHLLGLKEILEVLVDVCRAGMGCWGSSCAEAVNACTDKAPTAARPALLGFGPTTEEAFGRGFPGFRLGTKRMARGPVQAASASARTTGGSDGPVPLYLGSTWVVAA